MINARLKERGGCSIKSFNHVCININYPTKKMHLQRTHSAVLTRTFTTMPRGSINT